MPPKPWGPFRWAPIVSTLISTIKTYSIARSLDHLVCADLRRPFAVQTASTGKHVDACGVTSVTIQNRAGCRPAVAGLLTAVNSRSAFLGDSGAVNAREREPENCSTEPGRDVVMVNQMADDAVGFEPVSTWNKLGKILGISPHSPLPISTSVEDLLTKSYLLSWISHFQELGISTRQLGKPKELNWECRRCRRAYEAPPSLAAPCRRAFRKHIDETNALPQQIINRLRSDGQRPMNRKIRVG